MSNKNLSETLFKPSFNYPETSALIKRSSSSHYSSFPWYRVINKPLWIWRGVDAIELESVFSRIAAADHRRTVPNKLDTVIGYCKGNWVFEWSQQAMFWQQQAQECEETEKSQCGKYWLKAANIYSLASYPHLNGDLLALQAATLANRAYQEAVKNFTYDVKLLSFNVKGGILTGSLYLPSLQRGPYPTILLCGSLNDMQNDYHRLYCDYLAPAGIAVLCIDPPSIGYSSKWRLTQDTSMLHQQVLAQMADVPWIDGKRIVALGVQFGANIAVRLGYLEPKRLCGVVACSAIVHKLFVDAQTQESVPDMFKDVLASRLGLSFTTDALLKAEMASYSLKQQGLLGRRCQLPMLAAYWEKEEFSPRSEAELICSSARSGKLLQFTSSPLQANLNSMMRQIIDWINNLVN